MIKFQKFLQSAKGGDISLADFIHYVREHEKNLQLHFSHLDTNQDGELSRVELLPFNAQLLIDTPIFTLYFLISGETWQHVLHLFCFSFSSVFFPDPF